MLIIPNGISFRFNSTLTEPDTTPINLTDATTLQIKIKPPVGDVITKTATVVSAPAGTLYADVTPEELAPIGIWAAWALVVWADGRTVKSFGLAFRTVPDGTVVNNQVIVSV